MTQEQRTLKYLQIVEEIESQIEGMCDISESEMKNLYGNNKLLALYSIIQIEMFNVHGSDGEFTPASKKVYEAMNQFLVEQKIM